MHYGIIAAGEGSRLAQEGVALPKPLVKIQGLPMIGRLIDIFRRNGAESISVIVNDRMPEVAEYLRALAPTLDVPLEMVVKPTPSSMHSFYELSSMLRGKGRFIVTTVDTIFREDDFRKYVEAYSAAGPDVDGMMAVTSFIDDEKPLYVETDGDMGILAFRDTPWEEARYVSGGIYGLSEPAVDVLADCLERGVSRMRNYQRALVASGQRLLAYDMGKIVDVDHAGDIRGAEIFLGSGK